MKAPGFVLLDKDAGETSFKALFPLKRFFKTRRVGHAGTLDLRASGLIIAAINRATRLLPYVESFDKCYTFKIHFGYETETLEWDSEVIHQGASVEISEEKLQDALTHFLGEQKQIPPNYSAIKIDGIRASDRMQRGKEVTLPPRNIRIDSLRILKKTEPEITATGKSYASFELECKCSKGTYIRSLCRDLGHFLGTYACVSSIRRLSVGNISVNDAVKSSLLSEKALLSVDKVLPYPVLKLNDRQLKLIREGKNILYSKELSDIPEDAFVFAANENGDVKCVCKCRTGRIYPKFFIGEDDD